MQAKMSAHGRAGHAQVGSGLWGTLATIHNRVNAHREILENAISAGASILELELKPASALGATATSHEIFVVRTDTFIDLSLALDIAHAAHASGADAENAAHGPLNNFGLGLKVFQASLGQQTQVAIFTAKRERGVETIEVGRMGLAIDRHLATPSAALKMGVVVVDVRRSLSGGLAFSWTEQADPCAARAMMLSASCPWDGEAAMLGQAGPVAEVLRRLGDGDGKATLFVYHSDGSAPLPYSLSHEIDESPRPPTFTFRSAVSAADRVKEEWDEIEVDSEEEGGPSIGQPPPRPLAIARLHVRDKDNRLKDVGEALEHSYIDEELGELSRLADREGAPLPRPSKMPRVLVQGVVLRFDVHRWTKERETDGATLGDFFPVRVEGMDTPIAWARCCWISLEPRRAQMRGKQTAPRLWVHNKKLDGAYFVMHGRKVINESSAALFDGTVFEGFTGHDVSLFTSQMLHGGTDTRKSLTPSKYEILKDYWSAGLDLASFSPPPELSFGTVASWTPKREVMWPRLGYGMLSLIHLSPSVFKLDPAKTRVLRRDATDAAPHSLSVLVSAVRLALARWAADPEHYPAELPPRPARPRPPPRPATNAASSSGSSGGSSLGGSGGSTPWAGELGGKRVAVYWDGDHRWYSGVVGEFDEGSGLHYLRYDDGEEKWEELRHPGSSAGAVAWRLEASGGRRAIIAPARLDQSNDPLVVETMQGQQGGQQMAAASRSSSGSRKRARRSADAPGATASELARLSKEVANLKKEKVDVAAAEQNAREEAARWKAQADKLGKERDSAREEVKKLRAALEQASAEGGEYTGAPVGRPRGRAPHGEDGRPKVWGAAQGCWLKQAGGAAAESDGDD